MIRIKYIFTVGMRALKKVTLLGGSNSIHKNGMRKYLKKNTVLQSFALGASTSLQNLYELVRNKDVISKSDLIISESNVNDFHNYNIIATPISILEKNIERLYQLLSTFKVKVIVVLLPLQTKDFKCATLINDIHKKFIKEYGLDYIDMDLYYKVNNLNELLYFDNLDHPLDSTMYRMAESILNTIDCITPPQEMLTPPNYYILNASELNDINQKKNSIFCEYTMEIDNQYKIPKKHINKQILGAHVWSDGNSVLVIENTSIRWARGTNSEVQFHDIYQKFIVDEVTYIRNGKEEEINESSIRYPEKNVTVKYKPKLIALLLVDEDNEKKSSLQKTSICHNNCLEFLLLDSQALLQFKQYKKSMGKFKKFIAQHRDNIFIKTMFRIKKKHNE